ncbi:MAG: hypothetical protein FJX51_03015, partial [Alphaproteobacteria bacterium]|nr:hypothetical protein [Alphaproteobacteria bacterium]
MVSKCHREARLSTGPLWFPGVVRRPFRRGGDRSSSEDRSGRLSQIESTGESVAVLKKSKNRSKDIVFRTGEFVVYPTHGVGKVTGIETHEVSGTPLKVFVINFDKEKMTLRVPVTKVQVAGLRALSNR